MFKQLFCCHSYKKIESVKESDSCMVENTYKCRKCGKAKTRYEEEHEVEEWENRTTIKKGFGCDKQGIFDIYTAECQKCGKRVNKEVVVCEV